MFLKSKSVECLFIPFVSGKGSKVPKVDELVKNQKAPVIVIPVQTGIQENQLLMDSRFRGSDGLGDFLRNHQSSR